MHASVLLERGVDLLIGINPLVPFNSSSNEDDGGIEHRLAEGGLPAVLSQTFRTLLQSRMQVGLARYTQQYPDVDQLVFEPNAGDGELFFANAFGFAARRRVCELAYRNTLADLRARRDTLRPMLAAHGITLRDEVLDDDDAPWSAACPHHHRAARKPPRACVVRWMTWSARSRPERHARHEYADFRGAWVGSRQQDAASVFDRALLRVLNESPADAVAALARWGDCSRPRRDPA